MAAKTTKVATPASKRSARKANRQENLLSSAQIAVYARLSMVLDAFHDTALHYYSSAGNDSTKTSRANEIEDLVVEFQRHVAGAADMCTIGVNCWGVCSNDVCIPPQGRHP